MDPRHYKRVKIIQELYSQFFNKTEVRHKKTIGVFDNLDAIDEYIKKAAPKYEIDKIAKVDVAILRLAIYEMLFEKKEPYRVIINEAIEAAKDLSGDKSPGFINAVLGNIFEEYGTPETT